MRRQRPYAKRASISSGFTPPSHAGEISVGYKPKEYFSLSNSYGSFAQQRVMLETLLMNGIEPVAEFVIHHRDGRMRWAESKNPDRGTKTTACDGEALTRQSSEVPTLLDQRGPPEERPEQCPVHGGTTYSYHSIRDNDHNGQAFGSFYVPWRSRTMTLPRHDRRCAQLGVSDFMAYQRMRL